MGALPTWYLLIRAARYLQVPPWELAERPAVWMYWALYAESAENAAEADRLKRSG